MRRSFVIAKLLVVTWAVCHCSVGRAADTPALCALKINLTDADTGKFRPGILRIEDDEGKAVSLDATLFNRGKGMSKDAPISRWSVFIKPVTVRVPQAKLVIEALAGIETELTRIEIDLRGKTKARIDVPLRRFYDARARSLRSGNTHLHLMKLPRKIAERYLREIPVGDNNDVVFLSYIERVPDDVDYISNSFTRSDLEQLSSTGVLFGTGEEHRHNFGVGSEGHGHVMLLDLLKLIQPVSIGPGIMKRGTDGIPMQRGIDAARRDGATVIWCHNDWGMEDIPNWVTRRLHAQNIFDGGAHGSYKDSFYRYLDAGLKVPFSTGTDWFIYDFSRVYVPVAGKLTVATWLDSLAAGKSYITNGPFLEFRAGRAGLGDTVALETAGSIPLVGKAIGRVDFKRIELVQNGKVVHTVKSRPEGGHFVAEMDTSIEIDAPCWLTLRTPPPPVNMDPELTEPVKLNELGQPLFVTVAGRERFDRETAEGLLVEMEKNRTFIDERGEFAGDEERQRVLGVYDDAMKTLRERLK
jgi:hypothetical protein